MNTIHNNVDMDLANFYRIDINLYPLFIAIFELKSISKAAHMLNITQSAASHALQRLRLQLQDDLFIRAGHKMLPTPFAEQSYPIIKNALHAIQSISLQKQSFEPDMVKTLKIAVHDEIEPIIFPRIFQHFQQLNLDIQFTSIKLDRKTVVADLAAQQIDFVMDLEQNFGEKIQFQALVHDRFIACTQQTQMDEATYFASPHIGVSSRRTGLLLEDIYLQRQQLNRNILLRCQHYSTALQILEQNAQAILTLPETILSHLQVGLSLNIFSVPVELPNMKMGMFWHKDLNENKRCIFLREQINSIFA
ncbi:LysR family transcriptional regulator [Acinetobacter sp. ANC 4173]|uniref:LysR family transcriptional regulator n=1 Tax=Acinetobacter sp. ANC 4173 TaxID=2529837 RepID=UPI00103C29A0|nr:LysR family transcriptional regulator [Acinetobacter sp. ANC 4173]TCB79184.1 LysR family transcriptional regulator [Acinetobacter sp. ANC 4173]